ncbi:MAG: type II CAAX endopeptidase family protein [Pseudoclavibacter sp.]|nr:type II CAAX endopeptidase family protein [Pseudoclavibacter sp.]
MSELPVPSADGAPAVSVPAAPSAAPRLHPAIRVAILVLLLFCAVLSPSLVAVLPGMPSPEERPVATLLVQIVLHALVSLCAVLLLGGYARWIERCRLRELGLRGSRRLLPLLAAGTGAAVVLAFLAHLLARLLPGERVPAQAGGLPEDPALFWPGLFLVLVSQPFLLQGFPEELVFRGAVLRTLGARPGLAIAVSTLVFGALHLFSKGGQQNLAEQLLYLLYPIALGFLAAVLVVSTRSLWIAVGVHGGFHVGTTLALLCLGGAPGPTEWICGAVLFGGTGAALLLALHRRGLLRRPIVFAD